LCLTYVDSCVVVAAFAGKDEELARRALAIIEDEARRIVSSHFVWLEIAPKTERFGQASRLETYLGFFDEVHLYVLASELLVRNAMRLARKYGLGAMDALHVGAALEAGCSEFVTAEKPTKPFFSVREGGMQVLSILP
jgi:predicted nucleic acid-binding protein